MLRRLDCPSNATIPARDLRALGAVGRAGEALALTDTVLRGNIAARGHSGLVLALRGDTARARTLSIR